MQNIGTFEDGPSDTIEGSSVDVSAAAKIRSICNSSI